MNESEELYQRQVDREKNSADAGYSKFNKQEDSSKLRSNGSLTLFGRASVMTYLERIIDSVDALVAKTQGRKVKKLHEALESTIMPDVNGNKCDLVVTDEWAFLALKMMLDNAMNPVIKDHSIQAKFTGEARLIARKTRTELEEAIGKKINDQMALRLIQISFPNWYRTNDKYAKQRNEEGTKSTPSYWNKRMRLALNKLADKLDDQGDHHSATFIRTRRPWSPKNCKVIGELLVEAVMNACSMIFTEERVITDRNICYIVLSPGAKQRESEMIEEMKDYTHDLLPMLKTTRRDHSTKRSSRTIFVLGRCRSITNKNRSCID